MTAIATLRRVLTKLEASPLADDPDVARHIAGLQDYLDNAPAQTLGAALGLDPVRGAPAWWTLEGRQRCRDWVWEADRQLFGQLPAPTAARKILVLDRQWQERRPIPVNIAQLLAELKRVTLPGERQVRNIIAEGRRDR